MRLRLILASFLMLFTELALIRWLGSNVLFLSFFSNFVLLGSFLGIGLGFLRSSADRDLSRWAPVALAFLVLAVLARPVTVERPEGGVLFPGDFYAKGLPAWVVLPFIFVGVVIVMTLVAERVGRLFAGFKPLEAYRLDILGSLAGIVTFSLLSFLGAPPLVWGVIAVAVFLGLDWKGARRPLIVVSMLAMLIGQGHETLEPRFSWSPYYKIQIDQTPLADGETQYNLQVNSIPHQDIQSIYALDAYNPIHFHSIVYDHLTQTPKTVLIVGAGNGNDVAEALAHGAQHVDAVEIDPRIQQIGVQLHPNHPYDDPRVTVHINDGRAFLEQATQKFDLIVFALPDSLTLISGQSSLRLESYLFTQEAMATAHRHLNPNGTFTEYNEYHDAWLIDRLANTLQQVYGHAPCLDSVPSVGQLAVLTISDSPNALACSRTWTSGTTPVPVPVSDDYPFLYLQDRGIPPLYLGLMVGVLLAALAGLRFTGTRIRSMRPYLDLFFMGVAFLLLETKNVVQFALLFGTTWFVNALVFFGILVAVLLAIEFSRVITVKRPAIIYALLLVALAVAWAVPPASLLTLELPVRFACAVALAFAPIFLANVLFAQRFKAVAASTTAFGANLLGAMLGGLLEYSALIVGYRALLIVVAVCYVLAFVSGRSKLTGAAAT